MHCTEVHRAEQPRIGQLPSGSPRARVDVNHSVTVHARATSSRNEPQPHAIGAQRYELRVWNFGMIVGRKLTARKSHESGNTARSAFPRSIQPMLHKERFNRSRRQKPDAAIRANPLAYFCR